MFIGQSLPSSSRFNNHYQNETVARTPALTAWENPLADTRAPSQTQIALYRVMVQRIAWSVYSRIATVIELEDLVQIGLLAVIATPARVENRGDQPLQAYLHTRIRGAMLDALRQLSPLPRASLKFRRDAAAARAALKLSLARDPDDAEVAAQLGLDVASFQQKTRLAVAPIFEPMDSARLDRVAGAADPSGDGFECLEQGRITGDIAAAIAALPPREAQIIRWFFIDELSLPEIGAKLGMGASRVCQIKRTALGRLKRVLHGWSDR